ncbi:hypothetical protein SAMN02745166_02272 [Prosthecobacter debontii]|uniref:Uncharacterized protein n=1 Tax=Prosthecobacter debontii TaxID=48467 RepID=A0A1T4Y1B1_9BACT|nr:hypothetical protein [Prosthecobacter debontii]SKA95101.1 hypothetical protein SAMN02745166_02272 [Prosthecobacter debontii]
MKLSHLRLSLLSLGFLLPGLTQCTTPGTVSTRTGNVAATGGSFASGLGSFAETILDIPMTILSIPADILGDAGTMGAVAQAASSYNDSYASSSYGSGSSYSGYAGSSYGNTGSTYGSGSSYGSSSSPRYASASSSETTYTGVNKRLLGTGADAPDEAHPQSQADDDNGYEEGLRQFRLTQQRKVEAYKQAAAAPKKAPEPTLVSKPEPTGFSGYSNGYFYENGKVVGIGGYDEKTKKGWLAR